MLRSVILSALLAFPLVVHAGDLVLKDIKAQSGIQLSQEELNQLLPNARVVSYIGGGTRTWTHEAGGKFSAYGDARGGVRQLQTQARGHGEWRVNQNGQYCVAIEWTKRSEKWCRYIFKVGEKYYGVKSLEDGDAEAVEFEFKK
jgi:hypothetical protein